MHKAQLLPLLGILLLDIFVGYRGLLFLVQLVGLLLSFGDNQSSVLSDTDEEEAYQNKQKKIFCF